MTYPIRLCRQRTLKQLISLSLIGLMGLPSIAVWAEDAVGADWQPRPLVDNSLPAVTPTTMPATSASPKPAPAVAAQPELEARLKPAEPFVQEVENRLSLKPKPGATMVQRLNSLQTVLFGEPTYQDAGALITKLAEIFPQEAQKAQATMAQQFQQAQLQQGQNGTQTASAPDSSSKKSRKNALPSSASPGFGSAPNSLAMTQPAPATTANQNQPVAPKKKRGFWSNDDFDSDFDNDPFFQDPYQGRVKTNAAQGGANNSAFSNPNTGYAQSNGASAGGPSRLASIAQGLAGLALTAGALAGAYYLNNKTGGGNRSVANNYGPYPQTNYGYGPNGAPYVNGPYGAQGMVYGSPSPYGNGIVMNPYATSPYGIPGASTYGGYGGSYMMTPQPYQVMPYGTGITPYRGVTGLGF